MLFGFRSSLFLIVLALWILAFVGWVMNIVSIVHSVSMHAPFDVLFVLRVLGIPFGLLGAVLGWL